MRIVAYCRVSTDHEEQRESLANQEEFFLQFARKNGHELIKIYSDEGISGKAIKKRTQFLKMLSDAKLNKFDMVVVKDISRFARNTVDFLIAIRELRSIGVDVQFLSNNQTILGNSEFMLTVFSAFAQEESVNLSTRVKFGKKQNAKKGKVPNFIYGYNRVDKFNLTVDEKKAHIIRRIYYEYVDLGFGLRKIAQNLENDNITAPAGEKHWSPKTIRRILSNPIYHGLLITRKSECVDFITGKRRMLEPETEFVFENKNYRIIEEETFIKAKNLLEERANKYKNKNPTNRESSKHALSSLLRCPDCGYSFSRRISQNVKTPKYAYWKCSGNNNRGASFCSNNVIVKEEDIIEVLCNCFLNVMENQKTISFVNKIGVEKIFNSRVSNKKLKEIIECMIIDKNRNITIIFCEK